VGVRRPRAEIHHRGVVAVGMVAMPVRVMFMRMMFMGVIFVEMAAIVVMRVVMVPVIMAVFMGVPMIMTMTVGVLVDVVPGLAFDRGLAGRATANCTHQSTSSSLILNSSPEVICN
jgi:hypothetical protein